MGFVPQYRNDVFVSYARANNQSLSEGKPGWVSHFHELCTKLLDEGLGRCGASVVWMDQNLRGNEPFDEQLRREVSQAATLLVVLSDAYLDSKWCRQELEIFTAGTGGAPARTGRIFLVHYENVPPHRWPGALKGLSSQKYRFFHQEPGRTTTTPLGYPLPNPDDHADRPYYDRLRELIFDLTRKLKEQRQGFSSPDAATAEQTLSRGPTVFLAEVCGDNLYDQRQLVKSHLEQCGLRVLPTKTYGKAAVADMESELSESHLFVQMLGQFGGGFEAEHYREAVAHCPPGSVLRWRSRELKLDAVEDPDHRRLVDSPDVQALDFDELKRTIVDRVRMESTRRPAFRKDEHFVLVDATAADQEVAKDVVRQLEEWNVGYDMRDDTESLRDLAEWNVYDALLVIYGACPHEWVRQELIHCRKIMLVKKSQAPACAVYVGPPPKVEPLRCRPPRVAVIDTADKRQLRTFIESLSAQEVTP